MLAMSSADIGTVMVSSTSTGVGLSCRCEAMNASQCPAALAMARAVALSPVNVASVRCMSGHLPGLLVAGGCRNAFDDVRLIGGLAALVDIGVHGATRNPERALARTELEGVELAGLDRAVDRRDGDVQGLRDCLHPVHPGTLELHRCSQSLDVRPARCASTGAGLLRFTAL